MHAKTSRELSYAHGISTSVDALRSVNGKNRALDMIGNDFLNFDVLLKKFVLSWAVYLFLI